MASALEIYYTISPFSITAREFSNHHPTLVASAVATFCNDLRFLDFFNPTKNESFTYTRLVYRHQAEEKILMTCWTT